MKHATLALAVVLSAGLSFAQDKGRKRGEILKLELAKYDANGNGKLDENERGQILKVFDSNGNGKLDTNERSVLVKAVAKPKDSWVKADDDAVPTNTQTNEGQMPGFKQANTMGGGEAEISKNGKLRVFVLMGQSNMQGAARVAELKSPYNKKHDRIRIWANGKWEYFLPRQRLGPGVSMAHRLAELWPNDTL
jgi:hypothetical protein